MKIKLFENGVKINYTDDLPKVVKFFKDKKGIDITFTTQKTEITLKNAPGSLYLPNDNKEQDILMYVFDRSQRTYSYALNFSTTLQVVEISTSVWDDAVDYTWKLMCHEIMHSFFHRLRNQGIFLDDPMDSMLVGGVMIPYYKNEDPYAPDGNFATAFKRLEPYWNKLFPADNFFKTQEFVSRNIYTQWGEKSLWFVDPRIIKLANFTRKFFGKAVTINNWHNNGSFDQRGFREPESIVGGKMSQHRFGRAIDINVSSKTAFEVYNIILANEKAFMDAGLTCLEDIADTPGWCHLDVRHTGLSKILIVKP